METGSSVMELERSVSPRGAPSVNWSDNGTTFIGAEIELSNFIEKLNKLNIAAEVAQKDVQCKFSPHHSPFQDDISERIVLNFKRVLYTKLKKRRLIDEVLNAIFCLR